MELEYIDVVNAKSFEPWNDGPVGPEAFAIVAAEVGGFRLIDNSLWPVRNPVPRSVRDW